MKKFVRYILSIYDFLETTLLPNLFLWGSWMTGITFFLIVTQKIPGSIADDKCLVAPIGIIIASFIASASVMKSIVSNKKLHDKSMNQNKEDNDNAHSNAIKLQEESIASSEKLQNQSIYASQKLQAESIEENKRLNQESIDIAELRDIKERTSQDRSKTLFMVHICSQVRDRYKSIPNDITDVTQGLAYIHKMEQETENSIKLWMKLSDDKFFYLFTKDVYKHFELITHNLHHIKDNIDKAYKNSNLDIKEINKIIEKQNIIISELDALLKEITPEKELDV
ncbi:hypothetical protein [Sulfurimonas sp. CS5]|uniref:hypothetical protein n=1 Tax=Sulfurimonas sp. CS5 TaxID=3391145 RepID=UPI0039EA2795